MMVREKLDVANDVANKLKNMCDYTFVNHIQARLLGRIDVFDLITSRIRIKTHINKIIREIQKGTQSMVKRWISIDDDLDIELYKHVNDIQLISNVKRVVRTSSNMFYHPIDLALDNETDDAIGECEENVTNRMDRPGD